MNFDALEPYLGTPHFRFKINRKEKTVLFYDDINQGGLVYFVYYFLVGAPIIGVVAVAFVTFFQELIKYGGPDYDENRIANTFLFLLLFGLFWGIVLWRCLRQVGAHSIFVDRGRYICLGSYIFGIRFSQDRYDLRSIDYFHYASLASLDHRRGSGASRWAYFDHDGARVPLPARGDASALWLRDCLNALLDLEAPKAGRDLECAHSDHPSISFHYSDRHRCDVVMIEPRSDLATFARITYFWVFLLSIITVPAFLALIFGLFFKPSFPLLFIIVIVVIVIGVQVSSFVGARKFRRLGRYQTQIYLANDSMLHRFMRNDREIKRTRFTKARIKCFEFTKMPQKPERLEHMRTDQDRRLRASNYPIGVSMRYGRDKFLLAVGSPRHAQALTDKLRDWLAA